MESRDRLSNPRNESVPTVFSCETPNSGWLNLAQVRQLQFESKPTPVAVITWLSGDNQTFKGDDATAIYETWQQAAARLQSCCDNYRSKNRRHQ